MSIMLADLFRAVNPVVIVVAYAPLIVGLLVWITFYIRYDQRVLKRLEWTFVRLSNNAADMTKCRFENLKTLDELASDITTPQFKSAWGKMMGQVERRYSEEIIPEAQCFFPEDSLIRIPAHRGSIPTIWGVTLALVILSFLLPPMTETLLGLFPKRPAVFLGLLPAGITIIGFLIFVARDRYVMNRVLEAYHRFLDAFDTVLPTANAMAGAALLLDASRKNQKSFEKTTEEMVMAFAKDTEKISAAIDEFANGGVLPAIRETMQVLTHEFLAPATNEICAKLDHTLKQVVERQDSGIRELTDSFAARLADTLEIRMNRIAASMDQYQTHMEEQNNLYQDRIDELNSLLSLNMQELTTYMENQKDTLRQSEGILDQAAGLYRLEAENSSKLNNSVDRIIKITDLFREQTETFANETFTYTQENAKAQQVFGELVTGITSRMQEALGQAGQEIAEGINKAVGDNAKAIEDLTVQAQALREDYENFFQRSDDSSKRVMEEMDYQIQGIITRMSEDVGVMLKTSVEENGMILAQYKDQTADLLQSFDEQSRSMSIYAKEINMDIAELSENMGTSVAEFTEKIREGIQFSISDFDKGLAELAERIANTVENITDAVENLPASIKSGK